MPTPKTPVVHLELHTGNLPRATGFYTSLFDWRTETIRTDSGTYQALSLGRNGLDGGVVECPTEHPIWLPYVEVSNLESLTERARELGAGVLLEPREGPAGWRSVVRAPAGGEVGLWQPKG